MGHCCLSPTWGDKGGLRPSSSPPSQSHSGPASLLSFDRTEEFLNRRSCCSRDTQLCGHTPGCVTPLCLCTACSHSLIHPSPPSSADQLLLIRQDSVRAVAASWEALPFRSGWDAPAASSCSPDLTFRRAPPEDRRWRMRPHKSDGDAEDLLQAGLQRVGLRIVGARRRHPFLRARGTQTESPHQVLVCPSAGVQARMPELSSCISYLLPSSFYPFACGAGVWGIGQGAARV